jgi:hypothetical protein
MRGLLAAIRNICRRMTRALRAMAEEWIEVGGKMVRRLVPSSAPIEADEQEAVDTLAVDDFGLKVRALASQLVNDGTPSPDLMAALPPEVVRWLSVCDDPMLRAIARASDEAIQDHVKGRRYLRGVVRSDKEGLNDYIRSMMPDEDMLDDELHRAMAWLPA